MSGSDAPPLAADFADRIIAWQQAHGRHDLPWQGSRDPYALWVSEIMLQQTRVETVIPYYHRFLARFPDLSSLAAASVEEVLALWSGLGYYSRARNLHAAARYILQQHGGQFPRRFEDIEALPGVGRSTAGAIAAFAYGERRPILDGNVKRVLCRCFGVEGWPGEKMVADRLWALAEGLLPPGESMATYTQGLMDLGAMLCHRTRPLCGSCPVAHVCYARRHACQTELPAPRPRKALPERRTTMLVLEHADEVLLEKRPEGGLWGGLWSLPECDPDSDPEQEAWRLGFQARALAALPEFLHTFSHFRLRIRPQPMRVVGRAAGAGEIGHVWLSRDRLRDAALPAPVRRILNQWEAK